MANINDPINVRNHTIRNRVVLPPIVVFWGQNDGFVADRHIAHYRRRAEGGAGLIIVEATAVQSEGRLGVSQLGIWDDKQIPGLARIADTCHQAGAVVLIQIHHAGMKARDEITKDPIGPSDYTDGDRHIRAMSVAEIATTRDAFIAAAERAHNAGFDGVELHGAHGYLLTQFASPIANRRTDSYGGYLSGRLSLSEEIISGIRSAVPDKGFIIDYRMGCNEPTLDHGIEIAKRLQSAGVDILHVSSGFGGSAEPTTPDEFDGHWILWGGTEIKKHVEIPVVVVNGIRTHAHAEWLLDGRADFVALARGLLVDPDWPKKAQTGDPIVTCLECNPSCKWFDDGTTCPRFKKEWLPA